MKKRDKPGDLDRIPQIPQAAEPPPDPIDEAIAAEEAKREQGEPMSPLDPNVRQFVNEAKRPDGAVIRLVVPVDFDADTFETAVGMLMQLRVMADQRREILSAQKLVVPDHSIVGPDGQKLQS